MGDIFNWNECLWRSLDSCRTSLGRSPAGKAAPRVREDICWLPCRGAATAGGGAMGGKGSEASFKGYFKEKQPSRSGESRGSLYGYQKLYPLLLVFSCF